MVPIAFYGLFDLFADFIRIGLLFFVLIFHRQLFVSGHSRTVD